MTDKSIIPSMPTPMEKPVAKPTSDSGAKSNPLMHGREIPYSERSYAPLKHGAPNFPDESAGISHHYGVPRAQVPQEEIFKEETVKAGAPKERSQISRREFIRKLEGHTTGTKWRKELAKRLGIGNIFDPRVTEQVEIMVKKVRGIYGDDLISKHEFKRALGGFRHERYWEEKHHKQERLSNDSKITLEERRFREREEKGHEALHHFADEMFGSLEEK